MKPSPCSQPARVPLLLALLLVLPGCVAAPLALGAAGGLAAFKLRNNQCVREHEAPLRTTYDAVLAALPELGYATPQTATLGPSEGRIQAGDASVALAQFPEGRVRVAVRVGTFETADHRRRADLLQERIEAHLALPDGA